MAYRANKVKSKWHIQQIKYRANGIQKKESIEQMAYKANKALSKWHIEQIKH